MVHLATCGSAPNPKSLWLNFGSLGSEYKGRPNVGLFVPGYPRPWKDERGVFILKVLNRRNNINEVVFIWLGKELTKVWVQQLDGSLTWLTMSILFTLILELKSFFLFFLLK